MTAEAREIGADRLTDRVDVPKAADELQVLATTLNGMLDRLAAAMDRQRRFVADASHELRTPLAVMRAELDVSLGGEVAGEGAREVLESAREEVERMSRTVNDMLVLAQADEGRLALARDPVDLSDVAAVVLSRVKPYADARRTELRLAGGPAPALADRSRLRARHLEPSGQRAETLPRGEDRRGDDVALRKGIGRHRGGPGPRHAAGDPGARLRPILPRRSGARRTCGEQRARACDL